MYKFFLLAKKYRKYINVALNTYDDFQKHYENEFGDSKTKEDV